MLSRREYLRISASAGWLMASGHWSKLALAANGAPDANLSPFLQGNFAPVKEEVSFDRLEVVGQLPVELNGMFVRTGPNPQFPPKGNYHWFDGDGMLHGVRIADGKASYRNRYVRTAGWEEEKKAGKSLYGGLADPIDLSQVFQGKAPFKNAANTALVWHDGRLLALWEGGEPHEVKVPSLDTVGPYTFDGKLKHNFTAHPKIDPKTGEMMFFGYSTIAPMARYSVADRDGQIVRTETIRLRKPVMMHDFAITENYSIFLDLPASFGGGAGKGKQRAPGIGMRFDPESPSRFGLLKRHGKGDEIRWFEGKSCFVFHTLGAYEDGDEVVLLACRMDEYPDAVQVGKQASGGGNPLLDGPKGRLYRWRFHLADGTTREEVLDEAPAEFPRFDERRMGRAMRYGYCMPLRMDGMIKYDLLKGTNQRHEFGPGRLGGEGVFIPRVGGRDEDDGYLATYVFDQNHGTSELVLVDCKDFTAPPAARVLIPARIPFGFHGLWLDGELLEKG
ncbi:MAG: carotenoid oxygenase family protein [Planctomycetota bacterium]